MSPYVRLRRRPPKAFSDISSTAARPFFFPSTSKLRTHISRRLLFACTAVQVSQYIQRRRFIVPRITTTNNLPTRNIKAVSSKLSHNPPFPLFPTFKNKVNTDRHLDPYILANRVSNKIKKYHKNNDLYFYICGAGCAGMTVVHIILACGSPALRSQGPRSHFIPLWFPSLTQTQKLLRKKKHFPPPQIVLDDNLSSGSPSLTLGFSGSVCDGCESTCISVWWLRRCLRLHS